MSSKKTDISRHLDSQNLHHANLLEGDAQYLWRELSLFLEQDLGFYTKGNPDFLKMEFQTFGIEEARVLKSAQSRRPSLSEKKVIVILANFFTTEAQNSLLKVFEEPTKGTLLFILTPSTEGLLPTLLSRVQVVSTLQEEDSPDDSNFSASKFLETKPAQRIKMFEEIIDNKDRMEAINFLNSLERILRGEKISSDLKREEVFALEEVIKSRDFLRDTSSSLKIVLEHLSMVLPILSREKNNL